MKPIPHKQETGDTEGLLCPGTPWGPRGFRTAESVPSRSPSLQLLRILSQGRQPLQDFPDTSRVAGGLETRTRECPLR